MIMVILRYSALMPAGVALCADNDLNYAAVHAGYATALKH